MRKHAKKMIAFILLIIFATAFFKSCVPHKLNEKTFYTDENIELKVIRYLEVMFLHYQGPVFRVGCRSQKTEPKPWHKIQDSGWTQLYSHPELSNLGWDPDLEVLAKKAKEAYHVTDVNTMIYQTAGFGVEVTWNGCGSFKGWNVNKMPEELVNAEGYNSCLRDSKAKEGRGDLVKGWGVANCKSYRFFNDNKPRIFDMLADSSGFASFKVSSKAFLKTDSYIVETHDYGKSWNFKPVK